jgi:glutamate-1-semialdehyde 2,1-aminomutase
VTGRQRFMRFEGHYHGWFDSVAYGIGGASLEAMGERESPVPTPWTQGLPDHNREGFILLPWNDLALVEQTLEKWHAEVAAIITEPVMCNSGCIPPQSGFLEGLRELCDHYGTALIFDEVITGFRLGMGGAQSYFGVTPDLAIFAKAMANGYPISALVGRRQWMQPIAEGSVIHAGTMNSGNPTIAAALATLEVLEQECVHERLFRLGRRLMDGLGAAAGDTGHKLLIQGPGPMFHAGFCTLSQVRDFRETFAYDKACYATFVTEMQDAGIRLIGRGLWYLSAAHTEGDIDEAIATARMVLSSIPVG